MLLRLEHSIATNWVLHFIITHNISKQEPYIILMSMKKKSCQLIVRWSLDFVCFSDDSSMACRATWILPNGFSVCFCLSLGTKIKLVFWTQHTYFKSYDAGTRHARITCIQTQHSTYSSSRESMAGGNHRGGLTEESTARKDANGSQEGAKKPVDSNDEIAGLMDRSLARWISFNLS